MGISERREREKKELRNKILVTAKDILLKEPKNVELKQHRSVKMVREIDIYKRRYSEFLYRGIHFVKETRNNKTI